MIKQLVLESGHVIEELNKCLQTTPSASTVKERKRHRLRTLALLLITPRPPFHHLISSSLLSLVFVYSVSSKLALYDYFTGSLMYADRQRTTFLNSCHGSELLLSWRPFRARKKSMTLSSFYPSCLRYYQSKFWELL